MNEFKIVEMVILMKCRKFLGKKLTILQNSQ